MWKISTPPRCHTLQHDPTWETLLPAGVEGSALLVAGRRLHADHCSLMELGERRRAGVGRAAAQAGHDLVDQVLDAWSLRVEVHAGRRDALLEEGHPGAFKAGRVLGAVGDRACRSHAERLLVRPAVAVALEV